MERDEMKNKVDFFEWLENQVGRDDIVGDLASDVVSDRKSVLYSTVGDLHHRIAHSGCSEALDALKDAWNEFTDDPYPYKTELFNDEDDDTDDGELNVL